MRLSLLHAPPLLPDGSGRFRRCRSTGQHGVDLLRRFPAESHILQVPLAPDAHPYQNPSSGADAPLGIGWGHGGDGAATSSSSYDNGDERRALQQAGRAVSHFRAHPEVYTGLSMSVSDHDSNVAINIFVALLCGCIVFSHLLEGNRWVNESTTALVMGLITGGVILLVTNGMNSRILVFSEDIFFIYLLPPIIFNAGTFLKAFSGILFIIGSSLIFYPFEIRSVCSSRFLMTCTMEPEET